MDIGQPESKSHCSNRTNAVVSDDKATLWHRCFGHLSYKGLNHLSISHRVTDLPLTNPIDKICKGCLASRQNRKQFLQKSESRSSKLAEKVHSDLMGPMQVPSLGGSRYVLVFTDDHSQKSWAFFLKGKDETFMKFHEFKARIEAETGNKIRILRTDHGGDYLSNEFKDFCKQHGIAQELTQALIS